MTTVEVFKKTGLSKARIQQFARTHKIKKVGRDYNFTQKHVDMLLDRKGKRGKA